MWIKLVAARITLNYKSLYIIKIIYLSEFYSSLVYILIIGAINFE